MTTRINASETYSNQQEVHSLEESLAILESYKDNLTETQYRNIYSNICNFAIEDMFANQQDIIELIQIEKGEKTADEIIAQHKRQWGLL